MARHRIPLPEIHLPPLQNPEKIAVYSFFSCSGFLDLGFDMDELNPTAYSISGVPALLGQTNPIKALQDIIFSIRECGTTVEQGFVHPIALSLAQDTAITVGQVLTEEQMRDLVERLFGLTAYRLTPDGKTVLTIIDIDL